MLSMKKFILFLIINFLLISALNAASRKVVIDSVKIAGEYLAVDFCAEGIIDDKIAEGLRKGRTLTLEYKIQLWSNKTGILGQMAAEKFIRIKVNYDFWDNKFVLYTPEEERMTSSVETVREKCTDIKNFQLLPIKKIQHDEKYSISVEVVLRPLSVENYQEIKSWLGGEVKNLELKEMENPDSQERGFNSRLLRVFMAITGFGDRVISGKTAKFSIKDRHVKWE